MIQIFRLDWARFLAYFARVALPHFVVLMALGFTGSVPIPPAVADDWPQWRGARRDDVSREKGLLRHWPEGGPKLVWLSREIGLGYSGPAIVGNLLTIMGARDGQEKLFAIDVRTGKELWSRDIGATYANNWGDGPRGTPTIDGDRIYALGAQGNLICADAKHGEMRWQVALPDLGGEVPNWGYSESVLVDGPQVVCVPGGSKGAVAAFDKMTGKLLWQSTDFQDPAQYTSLVPMEHGGVRQYVVLTESHVAGIAAQTGAVLWQSDWVGATAIAPTPICHDGHVYVTSGYGAGCKLIRLEADGTTKDLYANKIMKNHHGGAILVGDHVYGYSDGVGWLCQNLKSGEMAWNQKDDLGKGAIACADGMLYCLDEKEGTVVLIEASPLGWKEQGRLQLKPLTEQRKPSGGIWTHPVIANGRLYVRDQELLFSFDVKRNAQE